MPGLSILQRYLFRELALSTLAVLLVLYLILLSNKMVRLLGRAASGELPSDVVFPMLGLTLVNGLGLVLPMTAFIAALLVVGRLCRDSEMTALLAHGVGPLQLARPLALFGGVAALLLGWVTLFVAPLTTAHLYQIEDRAEQQAELKGIAPGRFQESANGQRVIYVQQVQGPEIRHLFAHGRTENGQWLLTAQRATPVTDSTSGAQRIQMEQGWRYQGDPAESGFKIVQFDTHWIQVKEPEPENRRDRFRAMSTRELWRLGIAEAAAEWQWRVALPLSLVLFVLLGLPLGRVAPREGRFGRIISGVLVYLVYYKLLTVAHLLVERAKVGTAFGLWWAPLLLALFVAFLYWRELQPARSWAQFWRGLWPRQPAAA